MDINASVVPTRHAVAVMGQSGRQESSIGVFTGTVMAVVVVVKIRRRLSKLDGCRQVRSVAETTMAL